MMIETHFGTEQEGQDMDDRHFYFPVVVRCFALVSEDWKHFVMEGTGFSIIEQEQALTGFQHSNANVTVKISTGRWALTSVPRKECFQTSYIRVWLGPGIPKPKTCMHINISLSLAGMACIISSCTPSIVYLTVSSGCDTMNWQQFSVFTHLPSLLTAGQLLFLKPRASVTFNHETSSAIPSFLYLSITCNLL